MKVKIILKIVMILIITIVLTKLVIINNSYSSEEQYLLKASKNLGIKITYEKILYYYEEEPNMFGEQNHIIALKVDDYNLDRIRKVFDSTLSIKLPIEQYLKQNVLDAFYDESAIKSLGTKAMTKGEMLFYCMETKSFLSLKDLEIRYETVFRNYNIYILNRKDRTLWLCSVRT